MFSTDDMEQEMNVVIQNEKKSNKDEGTLHDEQDTVRSSLYESRNINYHDKVIKMQSKSLDAEHAKQQPQYIPFYEIIPYKSDYKSSAVRKFYPFWGLQDKGPKRCRDHAAISTLIGVISLFTTITQIIFVIYAPEPYKWISLTSLLIGQIVCSILFCISLGQLMHIMDETITWLMVGCFGCLFIPFSPIAIPIVFKIYQHEDEQIPLIITSFPSLAIGTIQAYPQIIIIAIMVSVGDYNLNTNPWNVVNCTFLASFISVLALSIQIASIFKRRSEFLATSLWLLFDFVLTLTITLTIAYDSNTLTIFYVDIALYGIWVVILITIISNLYAKQFWESANASCIISRCGIFWICFCGMLAILILIAFCSGLVMVVTMYFYSFSFVWFISMDQLYGWNICPMGFRCSGKKSNRYTLYEWIKNGENMEQRNDRLHSINMVILDNDKTLHTKYNQLCTDIVTNIRTSIRSSDQSVHQMTSVIDRFSVLTCQLDNEWKEVLGKSFDTLKWLMIYFPINRMLHFIVLFVIIIYAAFSAQWNNAQLDTILQVLFSLLLILLIVCCISFCIGWKAWNYHRLILPTNYNADGMDMDWNQFATQIANCHYYITALKVIADWCVDGGADKYIAYLIVNFMGVTEQYMVPVKYEMLLLGAGEVGKSTILRQVRHAYGRPFDESELLAAKPHLTQNLIEAMRTLAIYSDILHDQGKGTGVSETNREVRDRVARMSDKQKFTQQHLDDFMSLWREPGIKNTLKYRNQFQLLPNSEYLFENMYEYVKDEYIPTIDDLFNSYPRTAGVNKIKYVCGFDDIYEPIFEIFDTGGQKNERRKWMHFFDNTSAVIFVVNLSGFCELLWEDNRNNRLREDIGLFRGVVNLDVFKNCKWYIILNKYDLLIKNMRFCKMSEHFKDFEGNDNNENEIIEFVKQKLKDQRRERILRDESKMMLQFFVTNALNTESIESVFDVIHQDVSKHPPQYYF